MKASNARILIIVLLVGMMGRSWPSYADEATPFQKAVGGITIYLGVAPAKVVQGHPKQHPEGQMHGGVPTGGGRYHVTVALFDQATGRRITNADVTATVREIGLGGATKKLGAMAINGTVTYGNYFEMPSAGTYRIQLEIRRPGMASAIRTEFDYTLERAGS